MPQPPTIVQIVVSGTKKGFGESILALMSDGTIKRVSFPIHVCGTSEHYEPACVEPLPLL